MCDSTTGVLPGDVVGITERPQDNHVTPVVFGQNVKGGLCKDAVAADITEDCGPWMLVQRSTCNPAQLN